MRYIEYYMPFLALVFLSWNDWNSFKAKSFNQNPHSKWHLELNASLGSYSMFFF